MPSSGSRRKFAVAKVDGRRLRLRRRRLAPSFVCPSSSCVSFPFSELRPIASVRPRSASGGPGGAPAAGARRGPASCRRLVGSRRKAPRASHKGPVARRRITLRHARHHHPSNRQTPKSHLIEPKQAAWPYNRGDSSISCVVGILDQHNVSTFHANTSLKPGGSLFLNRCRDIS